MEQKIVSIIVTAYNVEDYIERCILSLMKQIYFAIEIIVVNDGSTDCTQNILEKMAELDNRISIIYKKNGGVSSARNTGITKAKGEYITFVDGDDFVESLFISKLVFAMENPEVEMACCGFIRKDWLLEFDRGVFDIENSELKTSFLVKRFFAYRIGFEVCNKLYRTSIIKMNSIFFDEKIKIGEDVDFNIKYLAYAKKINSLADKLYHYCIREESAMGKTNFEEQLRFFLKITTIVDKYYVCDSDIICVAALWNKIEKVESREVVAVLKSMDQSLVKAYLEISRYIIFHLHRIRHYYGMSVTLMMMKRMIYQRVLLQMS